MKKRFFGMVILLAGCTALTACGKTTGTVEESISAESVAEKESEEEPEATLTEEDVVSAIKKEVESEIASNTTGGSSVLEQTLLDGLEIVVNEMEETDKGYNVMVSFVNYDVAAGLEQMQDNAAGDGAEDYADQLASVLETTAKVSSDFEMFISVSDGECSLELSEEQYDAAIGGFYAAYGQCAEVFDRVISNFDYWVLFNEASFDTMTDGMKLDLCAYIFYLQGTYEMTNEGSCIFQNTDLQGVLNDYIDSPPTLISENSTEKLEIQSEVSYYPAGDWGETTISHTIDTIKKQGSGEYIVAVTYIETFEDVGENFTCGTMEYVFRANLGSKYGCALVDAAWEFEGWDSINAQIDALREQHALDIQEMCSKIEQHYTELFQPEGTYVCFEEQVEETDSQYVFILRYQMSEAEMEERIANGGYEAANIYSATIWVDKATGSVTDEWDWDTWNMW